MDYFDPVTNRNYRHRLFTFRRKFIISPEEWSLMNTKYIDFEWTKVKFEAVNQNALPETEGLYLFCASPKLANASFVNYLFYVGETNNIRRRFGDYLAKIDNPKTGQYKMYSIIDDYPNHLYFHYVELEGFDQNQRRVVENDFLTSFFPPINSKYPQGIQRIVNAVYGL